MTTTTPRDEERAARKRQRDLDRMHAGAARAREQETQGKLATVIAEELVRPRDGQCRCGLTKRTTIAQIMAMGAGCTAGQWVCPVLDAVRRRMGR